MEYYTLPQTNLKASKIALGCMRIASKSVEEVEELVLTALNHGVNFFDHADIYGAGQSEVVFGEVLARNPNLRETMIIQSKCAIRPGICFDFSKEYILKSVEGSLERLQTDYLDVLLLHRPDALMDPKEVAEAFNELYELGKVHYFGVSNQKPSQIELLKKYCKQPIVINQLQFGPAHASMIDQGFYVNMEVPTAIDYDGAILDYCMLNDITIQPWSTIRETLNSETFIDNPEYPELNVVLETLATKYKVSKVAIVTAWILRHPSNMQPIAGTTSIKNLLDTLDAINVSLTREEWYQIYTANKVLP
ncbi:aldo/keto reductase [Tannockella kyphosi]|uniref:aldo/keto reductase n=1 Tax=Tannockella kyphosi TaxID=2899121 RepID=UPI0020130ACB|nr:aldo/keto reductase [Tannockella kyphosi]